MIRRSALALTLCLSIVCVPQAPAAGEAAGPLDAFGDLVVGTGSRETPGR